MDKKVLIFATYVERELKNSPFDKPYPGFNCKNVQSTKCNGQINYSCIEISSKNFILSFNVIESLGDYNKLQNACACLNSIWNNYQQNQKRLFIHAPGILENDISSCLGKNNIRDFIFYHHINDNIFNNLTQIKKICQCQQGQIQQNKEEEFENLCQEIWDLFPKKQSEEEKERILKPLSLLHHRIAHLFLPMDIDLMGLIETDFDEEYWKEVSEAWENGKALKKLEEAWKLLYDKNREDSLENIMDEEIKKRKEVQNALNEIQNLLPREGDILDSLNKKFSGISQIFNNLGVGSEDVRKKVKEACGTSPENNPFHKWFCELDKLLNDLKENIKNEEG